MYVDNVLAISDDPKAIMGGIQHRCKFKNDKVEEPSSYLGARLGKKNINGEMMWGMASVNYINASLKNLKALLEGTHWKIPSQVTMSMSSDFVPLSLGSLGEKSKCSLKGQK